MVTHRWGHGVWHFPGIGIGSVPKLKIHFLILCVAPEHKEEICRRKLVTLLIQGREARASSVILAICEAFPHVKLFLSGLG